MREAVCSPLGAGNPSSCGGQSSARCRRSSYPAALLGRDRSRWTTRAPATASVATAQTSRRFASLTPATSPSPLDPGDPLQHGRSRPGLRLNAPAPAACRPRPRAGTSTPLRRSSKRPRRARLTFTTIILEGGSPRRAGRASSSAWSDRLRRDETRLRARQRRASRDDLRRRRSAPRASCPLNAAKEVGVGAFSAPQGLQHAPAGAVPRPRRRAAIRMDWRLKTNDDSRRPSVSCSSWPAPPRCANPQEARGDAPDRPGYRRDLWRMPSRDISGAQAVSS